MQKVKLYSSVLFLSTCAIAIAQTAIPPGAPKELDDELLKTKFQLVNTQAALVESQKRQLAVEESKTRESMQKLVIEIEAKYPGYTINFSTGTLIQKPAAPVAPQSTKESVVPPGVKK